MLKLFVTLALFIESLNFSSIPVPLTKYPVKKALFCNKLFLISSREVFFYQGGWKKALTVSPYDEIRDIQCHTKTPFLLTKKKLYQYENGFVKILNLPFEGIQLVEDQRKDLLILTGKGAFKLNGYALKPIFYFSQEIPVKIAIGKWNAIILGKKYLYFIISGKISQKIKSNLINDVCFSKDFQKFFLLSPLKRLPAFIKGFRVSELKLPGKKLLCGEKIFTYDEKSVYRGFTVIFSVKAFEKIISANFQNGDLLILTDKNLYLPEKTSVKEAGRIQNFNCPHLPPFRKIIENTPLLHQRLFKASEKWLENSRKRAYIPRVSLSLSYGSGNNLYNTKSDTISASAYTDSVIIGPPSITSRRDNSNRYEISISLTWEPDRLFFSSEELSIAYRLIDIEEEKRYIFNQLNENYTEAVLLKQKCCKEKDLKSCIELEKVTNLLKYYTNFSPELWKEEK